MSEVFFSSAWYRVATLRPRLRRHAQMHRHHYRGQLWYVLQDHASQRIHRFSPAAYRVIGLMDGTRTVADVWEMASARLGDDAPTQDEMIQLLTQLHAADVLQCDVPPDTTELLLRYERQRRQTWQRQLLTPFVLRLPLCDPERFLQHLLPWIRPFFGALACSSGCWWWGQPCCSPPCTGPISQRHRGSRPCPAQRLPPLAGLSGAEDPARIRPCLCDQSLWWGSARHGRDVPGVHPLPLCGCLGGAAFRAKWHRIIVGAAGMIVELFLASLALFVWLNVEPGMVRTAMYDVMFIAGISTVLFNGNPLLRYDGYYMFADYLEIPNLRARAQAYLRYLWERYAFGRREAAAEMATPSERGWFVCYGITAFGLPSGGVCGRGHVHCGEIFFRRGGIRRWGACRWRSDPAGQTADLSQYKSTLAARPPSRWPRRGRCNGPGRGGVCFAPVPLRSRAEGVIWVPERAHVRATADGFVERIVAPPGSRVRQGDVLVVCRDPSWRPVSPSWRNVCKSCTYAIPSSG